MKIFTSRQCLDHHVPAGFPERPERLQGVLDRLDDDDRWEVVEAPTRDDWRDAVAAVHDREYIARFEAAVGRGDGILDSADNPMSSGTWVAARRGVEAALAATSTVVSEPTFVATRPPGHHAERSFAMGFCFFNNVAIAAEALLHEQGLERVAIFDFDVHHGNGTQHSFSDRADVLYVSIHQFPFNPGTGAADERGVGAGEGTTLNLPLPAGNGDEVYLRLLEERVLPSLEDFAPDALLVSAGFDTYRGDPLGGMRVTQQSYRDYGRRLADFADRHCEGRLLGLLEGGYPLVAPASTARSRNPSTVIPTTHGARAPCLTAAHAYV